MKVLGVWNPQTSHAMRMAPLLEVTIESSPAPIRLVAAYFTFVLHAKTVQLVQPIWNWLAIPAQWQVQWIVERTFFIFELI